jgi:simple sugar transport system substrate-binding protein
MKKVLVLVVAAAMLLSACATATPQPTTAPTEQTVATSAPATSAAATPADDFASKGYKVAYILNGTSTDIFKMAFDGAQKEGAKLGIKVDIYTSDGDDLKFQDLVNQCAQQGYDGMYISHGKAEYAYDLIKPLVDKGIQCVTFDTVVKDASGNPLPGLTCVYQDDQEMARMTLNYIVDVLCKDKPQPLKVLKLWRGPGIAPFDRRQEVYKEFEDAGKIKTLEVLGPSNPADSEGSMNQVVASILPKYPAGSVDVIWSCYDAYGRGAYKALTEAGRTDIPLVSIDISNQDINYMLEGGAWKACVATHFPNVGVAGIRLLAMKLHGDETPAQYILKPSLVNASDLQPGNNVTNLGDTIPGYGVNTDNIPDWMKQIPGYN